MHRFSKTLIATAIFALPLTAMAEESVPAANQSLAPSIIAVRAEKAKVIERILVNGFIAAVEEILVQPQVEGLAIDELLADIGDTVEAGDVLARLSDDQLILQKSQLLASKAKAQAGIVQLQAQLNEVETNTAELEKSAARAKTLAERGTYSAVQAEQAQAQAIGGKAKVRAVEASIAVAEADITVVEAQIKDIDLKLARTEIKAPASGLITARAAKIGTIASAGGSAMFSMIRDGALELKADVSEADVMQLQPGMLAEITISGLAESRTGAIRMVEPTLDTQTRLGTVRIDIKDAKDLKAGLFADATIIAKTHEGIVVPVTSVGIVGKSASVLLLTDGRATEKQVKTGIRDGDVIEITDGLKAGDLIVAKAGAFVRDGDRVNPVVVDEVETTGAVTE